MRKQITVLVAATIAFVALLPPPAAAQDLLIPRRQPLACPAAKPYIFHQPIVDATHAVVGWYCTATEPVIYDGTSLTATATELNKNAGVTAGTSSASKTLVLGANKNTDILALPVSGLKIGAGAGTAVTASAAELNVNTGVVAGTTTASKTLVVGANKELDVLALPVSGLKIGAGAGTAVTASAAELNVNTGVTGGTTTASKTLVVGAAKNIDTLAVASQVVGADAAAGAATTKRALVHKKTGVADNSATDTIQVTVPNGNHAAAIRLTFVSSNGSTDAFESSRSAIGLVVLARTTGVATVATAIALTNAGIATVGSGATHTLAYAVTAMTGAVGATQTFTITVTIDDSGNTGSNQVVVFAELINAEASGVSMVGV